jgi:hypothetical protein
MAKIIEFPRRPDAHKLKLGDLLWQQVAPQDAEFAAAIAKLESSVSGNFGTVLAQVLGVR